MKFGVYAVYDKVADSTVVIGTANNDGSFVRQNLPYLNKINENFKTDYDIYHVGYYAEGTHTLEPSEPRLVSWDSYTSPENVGVIR